jgi:outer membrane protein assembly factor BamA
VNPNLLSDQDLLKGNPFFADGLLLESEGRRTVSKIAPSIRHNTVDHPIFPSSGTSYTATVEFAGIGGNTSFWKPILEGIWYIPHTPRTTIGIRAQYQHISTGSPSQLPVFERLWQGGEYSIRGFDIRRVGPTVGDVNPDVDPNSYQARSIIGGNKSLLFNGEYQISIAQPVRFVLFYDTGQVQDFGRDFTLGAFKTSTGVELRFFMPVLNVPFRLIYAWNPQRDNVFDDQFEPQKESVFRFAVGTTF